MESLTEQFNYVITQLATSVFIPAHMTVLLQAKFLWWFWQLMCDLINNHTDGGENWTVMRWYVEMEKNNYKTREENDTCHWKLHHCFCKGLSFTQFHHIAFWAQLIVAFPFFSQEQISLDWWWLLSVLIVRDVHEEFERQTTQHLTIVSLTSSKMAALWTHPCCWVHCPVGPSKRAMKCMSHVCIPQSLK